MRDSLFCDTNPRGVKFRLFVALELDDAVRTLAQRAAGLLQRNGMSGRYELPEKMHVTVAFLGATQEQRLALVRAAVHQAAATLQPFSITFDRLGAFPTLHRAHVVWVGASASNDGFANCARSVREACAKLGYAFEHEASPHVTICRLKHARLRRLPPLGEAVRLVVDELTLFASLPAGPTTRYEAIERARLNPGAQREAVE